jgi:acyl-CoA synthetase (AMP-forming)/AMP-acid ligase II
VVSAIYERFASLAAGAPRAVALIDGRDGRRFDRDALMRQAEALAARLTAAGLRARELVAVPLPNSIELVAVFLAAAKLDLVIVPVDRDAPDSEIGALLNHFAVRGLVYRADRSSNEVAVTVRDTASPELPPDIRLVKLSSGSTGKPKGILTTEANLIADSGNICASMDIRPGDINLGAIPLTHSYGFSNLIMPLFLQGTALVISNDYLPQSIVNLCNEQRCTVVPLIPMVFDHLAAAASGDFETVRTFLSAGAPLTASVSRRFRERFGQPVHNFYGCSECGGIAYDRAGAAVERGIVGSAMENVALEVDAATNRLTVRSASVATGYLHSAGEQQLFEPGTFVTDDLVTRDGGGELALTGRIGDQINTAGRKVNPREVEQVILQLAGVREAKVFGAPAGARGEVVAAAVVADPDVTRDQIREHCRRTLSSYKVPRIVKLLEQIPLDERGKFKRSALEAL